MLAPPYSFDDGGNSPLWTKQFFTSNTDRPDVSETNTEKPKKPRAKYNKLMKIKPTDDSVNYEYFVSPAGFPQLRYDNHIFVRDRITDNRVYWRCSFFHRLKCKARVVGTTDGISPNGQEHNHPPSQPRLPKLTSRSSGKSERSGGSSDVGTSNMRGKVNPRRSTSTTSTTTTTWRKSSNTLDDSSNIQESNHLINQPQLPRLAPMTWDKPESSTGNNNFNTIDRNQSPDQQQLVSMTWPKSSSKIQSINSKDEIPHQLANDSSLQNLESMTWIKTEYN